MGSKLVVFFLRNTIVFGSFFRIILKSLPRKNYFFLPHIAGYFSSVFLLPMWDFFLFFPCPGRGGVHPHEDAGVEGGGAAGPRRAAPTVGFLLPPCWQIGRGMRVLAAPALAHWCSAQVWVAAHCRAFPGNPVLAIASDFLYQTSR